MISTWGTIASIYPGATRRLAVIGVVSAIAGFFEAAVLVMTIGAAVRLGSNSPSTGDFTLPLGVDSTISVAHALWLSLGLSLIVVALHVYVGHGSAALSSGVLGAVRDRSLDAYASATWERQADDREGALQEIVGTLATQSSMLCAQIVTAVSTSAALLAIMMVAVVINPYAALAVFVVGAFVGLLIRPLTLVTKRRSAQYVRASAAFSESVGQLTSFVLELRVFGAFRGRMAAIHDANRDAARKMYRARLARQIGTTAYKDVAVLLLVGAILIFYLAEAKDLTTVGAVAVLVLRSVVYAQRLQGARQAFSEAVPNLELATEQISSLEAEPESFGTETTGQLVSMSLVDVGYVYPGGQAALKGISIELRAGEYLGIIGPSGGGKSTLAEIILRVRNPSSGTVTVNDHRYELIDPDWVAHHVSFVPQVSHLFVGTLADNIRMGREWLTDDDLRRAAFDAHFLEDVKRLPAGFSTMLGPRGSGLSGGQRQRLAIARSLAGRPELLVLDEPTSALDPISERVIQDTIEELRGRTTLVVIAHRLSTLKGCERVIGVSDGQIVAQGSLADVVSSIEFERLERA